MDNSELPDIIREIMSSSEFESVMQSIRGKDEVKAEAPSAPSAPTIPPDVLAKLPDVISALTGGTGDAEKITEKLPSVMSALSVAKNEGEKKQKKPPILGGDAQRKALLRALRPYMSSGRQNIIDNVIRFESMAEIMTSLMNASDALK